MKMTVSEKIARVFEIVGYLWLLPSIISLFYPLIFLIGSIFAASATGVLFLTIPFVIFGAGVYLLVKYFKHSRGSLDEEKIIALWVKTLVFNFLLLLPSVYGFYSIISSSRIHRTGQSFVLLISGLLVTWLSAAVLLSIAALMSEVENQKYR